MKETDLLEKLRKIERLYAGAATAGLLGFLVGLLTLRLRGIFFSIATIAITIILETVVMNWHYVGGAKGLPILRPTEMPLYFTNYTQWLFLVMTVIAVLAVATARYIQTGWIGRGLRAIRDNEGAAECSGVPTLKLKLAAATISGALMGAAGAPFAQYLSSPLPRSASTTRSMRWPCRSSAGRRTGSARSSARSCWAPCSRSSR